MTSEEQLSGIEWPDGWYIFERGMITGPHKTKEAFTDARQIPDESDEEILISRKGFSKWYNFSDLSSLYKKADKTFISGNMSVQEIEECLSNDIEKLANLLKKVEKEAAIEITQNTTLQEISSLESIVKADDSDSYSNLSLIDVLYESHNNSIPISNPVNHAVTKKTVGPKSLEPTKLSNPFEHHESFNAKNDQSNSNNDHQVIKEKNASIPKDRQSMQDSNQNRLEQNAMHDQASTSDNRDKQITKSKIKTPLQYTNVGLRDKVNRAGGEALKQQQKLHNQQPELHSKMTIASRLAYNHMMLAGRLRLGPLLSPFIEAYPKFIATLGFQWGIWLKRSFVATQIHLHGSANVSVFKIFLAMIPLWHFIEAYKLANMIAKMEMQNGYKRTSPFFATLLAMFPPFTISYLQNSMNGHWRLHVLNATNKKKPQQ